MNPSPPWWERPQPLAVVATLLVCAALWVAVGDHSGGTGGHGAHAGGESFGKAWSRAVGVWLLMMSAMMLPSATPMIGAFADLSARDEAGGAWPARVAVFVTGYLAVWSFYAVVAAGLQVALRQGPGLSAGGTLALPITAGALLVVAGAYQWLPFKEACLRHCRSPFAFLVGRWRPGVAGAFRVGAAHGGHCLGCCVALMGLMFVFGIASFWGMAALALYCVMERWVPAGERFARVAGAIMVCVGIAVLVRELG